MCCGYEVRYVTPTNVSAGGPFLSHDSQGESAVPLRAKAIKELVAALAAPPLAHKAVAGQPGWGVPS